MDPEVVRLTAQMSKNPGATQADVDAARRALRVAFPPDYAEFMLFSNGAEGQVGKQGYLALWPVHTLVEENEGYAVQEFAPGLVLFGSDGGDMAYAFDTRRSPVTYVVVPFIPMRLKEVRHCGNTLREFLQYVGR